MRSELWVVKIKNLNSENGIPNSESESDYYSNAEFSIMKIQCPECENYNLDSKTISLAKSVWAIF